MVVPCLRHHLQRHGNTYEHGQYDTGVTVGRGRRNLKGVVIFGFDGYSGGGRCGSGGVSTAFLGKGLPEQRVDAVGYGRHTHAYPDGKGVERPGKGIVAFARLTGNLIEVKHNGYTGHKEQEEYHPELLNASAGSGTVVAQGLPQQSEDAEQ